MVPFINFKELNGYIDINLILPDGIRSGDYIFDRVSYNINYIDLVNPMSYRYDISYSDYRFYKFILCHIGDRVHLILYDRFAR